MGLNNNTKLLNISVVIPFHHLSTFVFCSTAVLFRYFFQQRIRKKISLDCDEEEKKWQSSVTYDDTSKNAEDPSQIRHRSWLCSSDFHTTIFRDYQKQKHMAKKRYNASILPRRLILVRHGQSAGNVMEDLYSKMPDNAVPLTDLGWKQAKLAGETLRESILSYDETVHFIISPYVRTMETFHGILSAWCDPDEHPSFRHMADTEERRQAWYSHLKNCHGITWHEDPRIREQDFGNYQNPQIIQQCKEERDKFGLFYYRFPHGESATDVYDRVSTFLDSLWRSFDTARSQNCILVTHGISIRVFLARYFRYSVDQFHELVNPNNCEMFVLEHDGSGMLRPAGRYELVRKRRSTTNSTTFDESRIPPKFSLDDDSTPSEASSTSVSETPSIGHYEFHKELRTWPETVMKSKRRAIRISPKSSVASDY